MNLLLETEHSVCATCAALDASLSSNPGISWFLRVSFALFAFSRLKQRSSYNRKGAKNAKIPQTMRASMLVALFAAVPFSMSTQTDQAPARRTEFVDVAAKAGVQVRDVSGGGEKISLLDTVGHGAAWLDYDQDGLLDLYVVNGSTLARLRGQDKSDPPSCRLFRNRGDGTFSDETVRAGVGGKKIWGMGAAVGDIDNDGFPDLYVTGFGRNILYRNRGNGAFEEITDKAGVRGGGWCTSAAFGDYDGDGFLDLYVARYVDLDINNFPIGCLYSGVRVACGPMGLKPQHDLLYRNKRDGTFEQVSTAAGIQTGEAYFGLGVIFLDYNRDGLPDIYVANDATPANLWHNNGNGTFTDRGTAAGCAYNGDGREQARMGVDAGDYDRSGNQSIFTTNFSGETNSLFRNLGNGLFADVTEDAGLGAPSLPYLGWGTKFVDYDNDGWLDILAVNGHIYPEVDKYRLSYTYKQRILLFRNLEGKFRELAKEVGLLKPICGRGAAFADYDNDGDIDLLIVTMDDLPALLQNHGGSDSNFLTVRLIGERSNRDGVGAIVRVSVGGTLRTAEARSGGSYLSSGDPRVHFGVGSAKEIDSVEILWPSGTRDQLKDVPSNRFITVTEGKGITANETARRAIRNLHR